MSNAELFVSQSNIFSGFQQTFEKANYVIFGVPFDVTSTYRTGARFGPNAIRQASLNIETYSFRANLDIEDLKTHDLGDLHTSSVTEITLERIAAVTKHILGSGKTPIIIGGEHTITFGVMKGLGKTSSSTAIVSFDAHLDVRDSFLNSSLSHTTFMRRINEEINPPKIIEIGTRAVCKEELVYAKSAEIDFFPAHEIKNSDLNKIIGRIKEQLTQYESIYFSIDMDVLDPSYAPAVQNPEPDGLDPYTLLKFLFNLCNKKVIGFDIVEIAPNYDLGISSIQAAKIMFEVLCFLEKYR